MAVSRERVNEIKKRKRQREYERKRRVFLIRRVMLLLIAVGIILAVVLGIRGCVKSVAEKKAAEAARIAAEEAAKPTPTPAPKIDDNGIDQTFYDNSVFVGNSYIDGMTIYDLFEDADMFSKVGLTVSDVMTESTDTGSVPVIDELDAGKKYDKVFLMFGENEVGWIGDAFFEQYQVVLDAVKKYQPQAKIYIIAIPAISKNISEQNIDELNIDQVKLYNTKLKTLAQKNDAEFADWFTATVGKDGYLPANAATDGVHFGEDYYIKCLKYVQENCD